MAAAPRREGKDASCPFSAVRWPQTGQTRQRPSLAECGPHRSRATDAERLCGLRKRLAATETIGTIRAIGEAASELALTAPESLLSDIAAFIDRVHSKLDHLVPAAPKAVSEKMQAAHVRATDRVGQQSPAITMRSTAWQLDEFGNPSRVFWNAQDGASPP
jgi:hypothetical protein